MEHLPVVSRTNEQKKPASTGSFPGPVVPIVPVVPVISVPRGTPPLVSLPTQRKSRKRPPTASSFLGPVAPVVPVVLCSFLDGHPSARDNWSVQQTVNLAT